MCVSNSETTYALKDAVSVAYLSVRWLSSTKNAHACAFGLINRVAVLVVRAGASMTESFPPGLVALFKSAPGTAEEVLFAKRLCRDAGFDSIDDFHMADPTMIENFENLTPKLKKAFLRFPALAHEQRTKTAATRTAIHSKAVR